MVRKEVIDARPTMVRRLLGAWFRVLDYMETAPAIAAAAMAGSLGMAVEDYDTAMAGITIPRLAANRKMCEGGSPTLLYGARGLTRFLLDSGLLRKAVDAGFLFDSRFLAELDRA